MGKRKKYKIKLLPKEFSEMEIELLNNKLNLREHVIDAIEHSIDNNLESIDLFKFKRSEFFVSIHRENFLENLKFIYDEYINDEEYELCARLVKLENKLNNYDEKTKTNNN